MKGAPIGSSVVADLTGHPVEEIRDDVEALLDQFIERGLLSRS